jgi:hypothetical protein
VDLNGDAVGVVEVGALLRVPPERRDRTRVVDVASPLNRAISATCEEPLVSVLDRVAVVGTRPIVVLDGARPVGLITAADLTWTLRRADERAGAGHLPW